MSEAIMHLFSDRNSAIQSLSTGNIATSSFTICKINYYIQFEPPHDKTNKGIVRPAKTQISLGIRPV